MDDFSPHWQDSLLGERFWREQEVLNEANEARVEAYRSMTLHKRFPFNLSEDSAPRVQQSPQKRHRRRFSTSDACSLNTFASTSTTSPVPSSLAANNDPLPSTLRHRSPASFLRRAGSLLRMSLGMSGTKSQAKYPDSIDSILATPVQKDLGSPDKPLLCFRGGASWNCLPRDMETLCMDLFWPVNESLSVIEMLDAAQMAPLGQFRNLRVLRITGMMQSYQKYIWQAAWLNTDLDELELGMALPPRLSPGSSEIWTKWPRIKGGWKVDQSHSRVPAYFGDLGDGNLHPKVGTGEYLDKHAIEKAKVLAGVVGRTLNRLSIKKLTLSGFVVDAGPFIQWFDPRRLRSVHFKNDCIDAGFYLPKSTRGVRITFPMEDAKVISARRLDLPKNLKVVQLKDGKRIGEVPYCRSEILETKINRDRAARGGDKKSRSMSTPPAIRSPRPGDMYAGSLRRSGVFSSGL